MHIKATALVDTPIRVELFMFRLVLVCERQAGQFLVDHQQSLSEKSEHMMCYYCQLLWRTHITMSMHNDVYMLYILVVKRRELLPTR